MTSDPDDVHTSTCDGGPFHPGPCDAASPQPDTAPAVCPWVVTSDEGTSHCALAVATPATPAVWPEWLTPEHSNIHTAIENAMKQALAHCYGSADASGYGWTMDGLFSVAANSIMGMLRDAGCPPPAVGDVEAIPMPEDTWLADEDEPDEELPATPAERAVIDAAVAETEHEQAHGESSPRLRNARVLAVSRLWNADHPVDDPARLRSERNKVDG